jgi:hypothetical protein
VRRLGASAWSPGRKAARSAFSSAIAACEAVRRVTPSARASSARVRGPKAANQLPHRGRLRRGVKVGEAFVPVARPSERTAARSVATSTAAAPIATVSSAGRGLSGSARNSAARGEPGQRQRRRAEREQVRAHCRGERGRPGAAARGKRWNTGPRSPLPRCLVRGSRSRRRAAARAIRSSVANGLRAGSRASSRSSARSAGSNVLEKLSVAPLAASASRAAWARGGGPRLPIHDRKSRRSSAYHERVSSAASGPGLCSGPWFS